MTNEVRLRYVALVVEGSCWTQFKYVGVSTKANGFQRLFHQVMSTKLWLVHPAILTGVDHYRSLGMTHTWNIKTWSTINKIIACLFWPALTIRHKHWSPKAYGNFITTASCISSKNLYNRWLRLTGVGGFRASRLWILDLCNVYQRWVFRLENRNIYFCRSWNLALLNPFQRVAAVHM